MDPFGHGFQIVPTCIPRDQTIATEQEAAKPAGPDSIEAEIWRNSVAKMKTLLETRIEYFKKLPGLWLFLPQSS